MNLKRKLLFERILHGKANLEPVQSDLRVVYERPDGSGISVLIPDPNWMAMAQAGGYLPPVDVYLNLQCEWTNAEGETCITDSITHPGPGWTGGKVLNGHMLHLVHPIDPLTEEQAIEYLIQKDIPRTVWQDTRANRPKFIIVHVSQLPATRAFRNAWTISEAA